MSLALRFVALFLLVLPFSTAFAQAPPVPLAELDNTGQGGFDRVSQMARRADGRIYIADSYNNRIVIYSAEGYYLGQMNGTGSGPFNVAAGVAFDPDGNLYVAEQFGDRITKFSSTHLPLRTFGGSGSGPGQLDGPTNLAIAPDGSRLYVTEFLNHRVSMFDLEGNFIGSFGARGSSNGEFQFPYGIVVNAAGEVFVADQNNHRVQHFSSTGAYLSQFGGPGSGPGQFQYLVGLGIDGAGDLYATDQLNNRIQKLRQDGTPLLAWGTFGSGTGEMYNPWSVLPLPDGQVWVGDTYNQRISVYGFVGAAPIAAPTPKSRPRPDLMKIEASRLQSSNSPGVVMAGCSESPPAPTRNIGGFNRVGQITRRADGRIYVADSYNDRIVVYSSDGVYLEQFGSQGSRPGEFFVSSGIAFDAANNIYVAEQFGDRISKLSSSYNPLLTFGTFGAGPGQLNVPTNLALSLDGSRLYVTELNGNRVSTFHLDGAFAGSFGSSGTGPGQFAHPFGIVVDEAGEVFIADQYNHRVQRFDADGGYLGEWGGPGTEPGRFQYVVGLGLDRDGNIYATDQLNNRIQKLTRDGTPIVAWGSLGPGLGQMYNPWAVTPLPNGEIWIGDTYNFRVSVYGPGTTSLAPTIVSITDVPGDRGKQVRITFEASSLDVPGSPTPIVQYEAYRRIDSSPLGTAAAERAATFVPSEAASLPSEGPLLEGWEFVGAVPAHAESEYSLIAPTLIDSKPPQRIHWTAFFLRAATSQPAIFHDSCIDSGYSTKNKKPKTPVGFAIVDRPASGDFVLGWLPSDEPEMDHYSLYRSTDPEFVPGASNRIAEPTGTSFVDAGAAAIGANLYYKLSVTDIDELTSDFATTSSTPLLDAGSGGLPVVFRVHPIEPNPMTASAGIRFELPVPTEVTIEVFDLTGRLVQVLGKRVSLPAGLHRWEWNGRNLAGARVPEGVYFHRFQSREFSTTRAVILTR